MTRAQFTDWLQNLVNEMHTNGEIGFDEGDGDCGDVWRKIEDEGMLEKIGVPNAVDYAERDFVFRLRDGLLASGFSYGTSGQTVWWFPESRVNLRAYKMRELADALGRAWVTARDLENLMPTE